jgi:hypothetical protein
MTGDFGRQEHGGTTLVPHPQGAAMPCVPRAVIAARHPRHSRGSAAVVKQLTA